MVAESRGGRGELERVTESLRMILHRRSQRKRRLHRRHHLHDDSVDVPDGQDAAIVVVESRGGQRELRQVTELLQFRRSCCWRRRLLGRERTLVEMSSHVSAQCLATVETLVADLADGRPIHGDWI